jgi:glycosyltransferase involved in cell wall biosynthesis
MPEPDSEARSVTRIAVLIPAYNSGGTISETLRSLRAQAALSARVVEICIADDASSDDTVKHAETLWSAPPALTVMRRPANLGQWRNVNDALAQLTRRCDWVLLVHADDILKPNWFELMTSRIDACGERVASICSSYDQFWPDGSINPGKDEPQRDIDLVEGGPAAVTDTLRRGCWWHISGCAIRCESFLRLGPFTESLSQMSDWEWLLRLLSRGYCVEYIPRTLSFYRQHAVSVSSGNFGRGRDVLDALEIFDQYQSHGTLRWNEHALRRLGFALYGLRRLARQIMYGHWNDIPALLGPLTRRLLFRR